MYIPGTFDSHPWRYLFKNVFFLIFCWKKKYSETLEDDGRNGSGHIDTPSNSTSSISAHPVKATPPQTSIMASLDVSSFSLSGRLSPFVFFLRGNWWRGSFLHDRHTSTAVRDSRRLSNLPFLLFCSIASFLRATKTFMSLLFFFQKKKEMVYSFFLLLSSESWTNLSEE